MVPTRPLWVVEHEKELKTVIKRLRCLLADCQSQLEKAQEQGNQKSQMRLFETKVGGHGPWGYDTLSTLSLAGSSLRVALDWLLAILGGTC